MSSLEEQAKQLAVSVQRQVELAGIANSIEEFCARVSSGLSQLDFEQKRRLVELLIDRVVVRNEEVEIRYVVPTSARSENTHFYQLVTDYFRKNNFQKKTLWWPLSSSELKYPILPLKLPERSMFQVNKQPLLDSLSLTKAIC